MPKTTMDGTEQIIFESTELGEYSGYVFLDKMQSGDKIILKAFIKDVEDSEYKLADSQTYENAQAIPTIRIAQVIGKVGIKLTAQQTLGTNRVIDHMWFKR